jgi:hypothetical protein
MQEHDWRAVAGIANGNGQTADLDFFHAVFPLAANKSLTDMIGKPRQRQAGRWRLQGYAAAE